MLYDLASGDDGRLFRERFEGALQGSGHAADSRCVGQSLAAAMLPRFLLLYSSGWLVLTCRPCVVAVGVFRAVVSWTRGLVVL